MKTALLAKHSTDEFLYVQHYFPLARLNFISFNKKFPQFLFCWNRYKESTDHLYVHFNRSKIKITQVIAVVVCYFFFNKAAPTFIRAV